jgi:hypothetical protein
VLGALLVRTLNAQFEETVASSSALFDLCAAGTGGETTSASDALASDASSSGLGGFGFSGPTATDSASSSPFDPLAFAVDTADVIFSTSSPSDSASATDSADLILATLDSTTSANTPASTVLSVLDPSSSISDDGVRFGSIPITSTTSVLVFSLRTASSRSAKSIPSRRAGVPAFAPLPVDPGRIGGILNGLGAAATPSSPLNLPRQPGGLRPSPLPAVGKAKASPSAKSAVGKFDSLSVEDPGAGGAVNELAVPPGGATGGKLRRAARQGSLSGFSWPTKQGSSR